MTEREHQLACLRFIEIEAELEALAAGRVVEGDPVKLEEQLLAEQDEIEFQLSSTPPDQQ